MRWVGRRGHKGVDMQVRLCYTSFVSVKTLSTQWDCRPVGLLLFSIIGSVVHAESQISGNHPGVVCVPPGYLKWKWLLHE